MARHQRKTTSGPKIDRRTLLRWFGGGVAAAAAGGVAGAPTGRAAAAAVEATLRIGDYFNIKSLDPARTLEILSWTVGHATYDSLVTFDGEDLRTPRPQLATAWKISPDGRVYSFTLRPNVRFQSGNPLTSADVKWSFDRVNNVKSNPAFFLAGVEDVQAPAPMTVVVRMKQPQPSILPILSSPSLGVLDSKVMTANGGDAGPEAKDRDKAEPFLHTQSPGSGAFMLAGYTPNQEVVLVKNPGHWRGAPKVDRIVIRNITEPATQQLELLRGDLDIATGLGQPQVQALRRVPGVTMKTTPAATTFYILMNNNPQTGGPFANPKVQQAVRYALDYQGLMEIAGAGAIRLAGVIPPSFPGALDSREAVKTDRERARALLREANLGEVRGQITHAKGWIRMGVEMDLVVQKIQSDLAAVGIRTDLNGLPLITALQQYRDGKNQVGVWAYAADYPDADDYLVYLPGRLVGRRAGWMADANSATQELGRWGQEAETEVDGRKRAAIFQKIERRLAEIGPYAPLFTPAIPYAFRSNVQGVTFNSVWGLDLFTIGKGR